MHQVGEKKGEGLPRVLDLKGHTLLHLLTSFNLVGIHLLQGNVDQFYTVFANVTKVS